MVLNRSTLQERFDIDNDWTKSLTVEPLLVKMPSDPSSVSIDFHLGNRFAIFPRRRVGHHRPMGEENQDLALPEFYVPMGGELILHPGEVILGTTFEWFCFPCDLMAYVIVRSIWGRRGLVIATALAVQPTSTGLITLELTNVGDVSIYLNPGACIGQLFFHRVEKPQLNDTGRRSPFSGSGRPQLGNYSPSPTENILMTYQKKDMHLSQTDSRNGYCRMSYMGPT